MCVAVMDRFLQVRKIISMFGLRDLFNDYAFKGMYVLSFLYKSKNLQNLVLV